MAGQQKHLFAKCAVSWNSQKELFQRTLFYLQSWGLVQGWNICKCWNSISLLLLIFQNYMIIAARSNLIVDRDLNWKERLLSEADVLVIAAVKNAEQSFPTMEAIMHSQYFPPSPISYVYKFHSYSITEKKNVKIRAHSESKHLQYMALLHPFAFLL